MAKYNKAAFECDLDTCTNAATTLVAIIYQDQNNMHYRLACDDASHHRRLAQAVHEFLNFDEEPHIEAWPLVDRPKLLC